MVISDVAQKGSNRANRLDGRSIDPDDGRPVPSWWDYLRDWIKRKPDRQVASLLGRPESRGIRTETLALSDPFAAEPKKARIPAPSSGPTFLYSFSRG